VPFETEKLERNVLFINTFNLAQALGLTKHGYYIICVDSELFTQWPLIFTSLLFMYLLSLLVYILMNNKLIAEKAL